MIHRARLSHELVHLVSFRIFISLYIDLWYWRHDGKRIVPVTVQVWECLGSLLGTALIMERVSDGSVGATDISKSRCPGPSGSKNTARLTPVWS
jgi:hypothetical protein